MTTNKRAESSKEHGPTVCCTTIFGVRPLKLCNTLLFGYGYILIILILYYVLFYFTMDNADEVFTYLEIPSFTAIKIRRLRMIFNIVFLPLMVISSAINFGKVRDLYSDLNELDQKLRLFNAYLHYAKYKRKNILYVSGIILFTTLIGIMEFYNLKNASSNYMYTLMWLSNQFPQIVNSVAISAFVVVVADISRRFQVINGIILNLIIPKKEPPAITQDMNNVFHYKLLQQSYRLLSNIIVTINNAYGFLILITISVCLFGMCGHLIVVVRNFGYETGTVDVIVDSLWSAFYFGKLVYIVEVCHTFRLEGKRASQVLHEYRVDSDNPLLKQETDSFAQQVRNVDIKITACNFFDIDYPLLCKVVLAMTAYVFFLSQFYSRLY